MGSEPDALGGGDLVAFDALIDKLAPGGG